MAQESQVVDQGYTTIYLIGGLCLLAVATLVFRLAAIPLATGFFKSISGKLVLGMA